MNRPLSSSKAAGNVSKSVALRLNPYVAAIRTAVLAFACTTAPVLAQPAMNTLPLQSATPAQGATVGVPVIGGGTATLNISQAGNFARIDWASFNVADNGVVNFLMPGAQALSLNVIDGAGGLSQIYGQINSRIGTEAGPVGGTVALINPAGLMIGPSGVINVGGLIASGLNLKTAEGAPVTTIDADGAGDYVLDATGVGPDGRVVNDGAINAGIGGATLVGRGVTNTGTINVVSGGTARLLAADGATLTVAVPAGTAQRAGPGVSGQVARGVAGTGDVAAVSNSGTVTAAGGLITLQAVVAPGLLTNVVNNTGMLSATANVTNGAGGNVLLSGSGGSVSSTSATAAPSIQARGDGTGSGGTILVSSTGGVTAGGLDTGNAGTASVTLNAGSAISDGGSLAPDVVTRTLNATATTGIDLDTNVDILATANGGTTVDISDSTGNLAVGAVSGSNVTLSTQGSLTNNSPGVTTVAATGLLNVSAGTGIDLDTAADMLIASVSGPGIIAIRDAGPITLTSVTTNNGSIDVTAGGTIAATSVVSTTDTDANDITLTATAGNIVAGTINAGATAGDVTLNANTVATQQILGDAAGTGTRITGDRIALNAGDGIGTTATSVDTAGVTLAAATATGTININELGSISTADTFTSGGGDLILSAGSGLDIGARNVGNTNDLVLETRNAGADLVVSGQLQGDNVTLNAAGAITQSGSAVDVIATTLTATTTAGAIDLDTQVGSLSAAAGGNGNIEIDHSGTASVALTNVGTGGTIRVGVTGDVTSGVLNSTGSSTTLSATGSIAGTTATGTSVNLTATSGSISGSTVNSTGLLTAIAATGIGLNTSVGSITADVTGTGDLTINETSGVILNSLTTGTGNIGVTAAGPITATSVAASGGNTSLVTTAGGDIAVGLVSGSNVTLNAAGAITDGNGAGLAASNVNSGGLDRKSVV